MNQDERRIIDELFGKLAAVERDGPVRDAEAERYIAERVARQPAAPYYLAQTVLVQEQALEAAQARIEELEARAERASGGGFLGALFGGGRETRRHPPRAARPAPGGWSGQRPGGGRMGGGAVPAGGGFLAGAMQTAVGVAGGVLIGSMIADALTGDAGAAELDPVGGDPGLDPGGGFEDAGFDGGFDFGDGF